MGKQSTVGTTIQDQDRSLGPRRQQLQDVLSRAFLGQLVNPPETAVSVPHQQAVSNLQGGFPAMLANFGLGQQGGLAGRLSAQPQQGPPGTGAGALLPQGMQSQPGQQPGQQWGLQERESLGIPPRRDNLTFVPSAEDIAAIGIAPIRSPTKKGQALAKRETRLERKIDRREAKGKSTEKQEKRLGKVRGRQEKEVARGETYL